MIQLTHHNKEKKNLDDLLKELFPDVSSSKLKKIYQQHRILRNGFLASKDCLLKVGDKIEILKKPTFLKDLLIYYEDNDCIVLEKPAGLLSVDSDRRPGESIHSTLKRRYGAIFPVHRLDKETTGVMVFTKNRASKEHLGKQFENKAVERAYVAIVESHIESDQGTWNFPLEEGKDLKVRVSKAGRPAITNYTVLKRLKSGYTYVECSLKTGRKNQIRAHASHVGHSLLGDCRYGKAKKGSRLFLHAKSLVFTHPRREKKISFISPIPKDFKKKVFG